jgi:hypothetical protein
MSGIIEMIDTVPEMITALNGVVIALIGVFTLIKGDQPEKTLRKIANFLEKFSRK